jgi:hypothetical protein
MKKKVDKNARSKLYTTICCMTFTLVHKSSNATLSCVPGKILTKGEHQYGNCKERRRQEGRREKGRREKGRKEEEIVNRRYAKRGFSV